MGRVRETHGPGPTAGKGFAQSLLDSPQRQDTADFACLVLVSMKTSTVIYWPTISETEALLSHCGQQLLIDDFKNETQAGDYY